MTKLNTIDSSIVESLVLDGDLSKLRPNERLAFYIHRCKMLKLDPAEQPFQLLKLNGKLMLYATKTCAAALTRVHGLSTEIRSRTIDGDMVIVEVRASTQDGRFTDDIGALLLSKEKTLGKANAMMKAVTKAKRRAVLALVGLGMLDESEVIDVQGAQRVTMDVSSGAIDTTAEQRPAPRQSPPPRTQQHGPRPPGPPPLAQRAPSEPETPRTPTCTGKAAVIAVAIRERTAELARLLDGQPGRTYARALERADVWVQESADDLPPKPEQLSIDDGKAVSELLKGAIAANQPPDPSQLEGVGGDEFQTLLTKATDIAVVAP